MAITTNYDHVKKEYNNKYWDTIEEFEYFYLREIQETSEHTNIYTDKNGVKKWINPIDNYPILHEYEVWMEGYAATGEHQKACLVGKAKARNFAQACHIVMCKKQLDNMKNENREGNTDYVTGQRWDYDPNSLSFWGRKLFWHKELATKTFN